VEFSIRIPQSEIRNGEVHRWRRTEAIMASKT
jgi:hypothetical protein